MVVENVVVNHHVLGCAVGVVEAARSLDVVRFSAVGHVDELEPVIAANPQQVGANVGHEAGHVVVAAVEYAVVLGEGHQPLVGRDVVAQHPQPFGADVGDVAHDLDHGVPRLGALTPIVVVSEIGFRDEPHAGVCSPVHVVTVHANAVGGPVGHAVVDVLTVVNGERGQVVLAHADVGAGVEVGPVDFKVKELVGSGLPRGTALAEGRGRRAVPLSSTLLGADVKVGTVGLQCVNLVGGEDAAAIAGGDGGEDLTRAHVLPGHAVPLKAEVKDVPDHGDGCVVDSVDAGGAPGLKPRVVGDVVAQHTFVFCGHVGRGVHKGNVPNKGSGQTVGGVVGGAGSGASIKVNKHPAVKGQHEIVCVGRHAQDAGRTGVASGGPVKGLNAVSAGVHLFDERVGFKAKQERGCSLSVGRGDDVVHVVRDGPRCEPDRVADVVTQHSHGVVSGAEVEHVVDFDQPGHVVRRRCAGQEHLSLDERCLVGREVDQVPAAVVDEQGVGGG